MYIWSLTYLNSYCIDYKMFRNICLIGLPTAGKSQIGKQLYQHLKMGFIDTDDLIRQKYNRELPELIEQVGNKGFLDIETEVIQSLNHKNVVLATGGSVIYRKESMNHIKNVLKADVYHLFLSKKIFIERMTAPMKRSIVMNKDQTFDNLYNERMKLYDKHTDFIIKACEKVNLNSFKPYYSVETKTPMIMYTNKTTYNQNSRPCPPL